MKPAFLLVIAPAVLAAAQSAPEQPAKASCAIVGFVNQVDHKEWRDGRVGMGVRAMLTQSLAETDLFALLEEKEEIKAKLDDLARRAWLAEKGEPLLDSAAAELKKSGARFIASGRVFYFGRPRTRASFGPAHFGREEVEIKIEVTLADASGGKKMTEIGSGKAATTAASGIFTFHGENLDAEASMVGTATKKAVDAAVAEIAKKYRKAYNVK